MPATAAPSSASRSALRQRLLSAREAYAQSPAAAGAQNALTQHLGTVLAQLVPQCLGVYWPIRFEFNAAQSWQADEKTPPWPLALPFALRDPRAMHYRRWDGRTPTTVDECGIASTHGEPVVPDVILVPCVGYTDTGYRLGYGGGYFDRYMAAHPHVTAVGVAWSSGRLSVEEFAPAPHDQPLMLIVTEQGVVS